VDYLYWRWLELTDPAASVDAAPEYVPDGSIDAEPGASKGGKEAEGPRVIDG